MLLPIPLQPMQLMSMSQLLPMPLMSISLLLSMPLPGTLRMTLG
jgi:hypothetical protein